MSPGQKRAGVPLQIPRFWRWLAARGVGPAFQGMTDMADEPKHPPLAAAHAHLQKYADYIRDTELDPLPVSVFLERWGTADGRMVLTDMVVRGLLTQDANGVRLTEAGHGRV